MWEFLFVAMPMAFGIGHNTLKMCDQPANDPAGGPGGATRIDSATNRRTDSAGNVRVTS